MTATVKARMVGGATGITIPREMRDRYKIENGDSLTLIATENGILVTPFDQQFETTMTAARSVMRQYRNALRNLASK